MKVTDAVRGEHCVLYALLDHLEASLADPHEPFPAPKAASLLAAALEPHARLEDELLLEPLLATTDDPAGPVRAMIDEHDEVRSLLTETQGENDGDSARDLLLNVIRSVREHFEREERLAVPMAERTMEPARLEALGARWLIDRGVSVD